MKKIFRDADGNFEMVEMKVKKWHENRMQDEEVETDVTQRMLRKQYFWDELGSESHVNVQGCNLQCFQCAFAKLMLWCVAPLRDMIKFAWNWAKQNGKWFKSTVHGAEMITIDVNRFRRRFNESGTRMTQSSTATLHDSSRSILDGDGGKKEGTKQTPEQPQQSNLIWMSEAVFTFVYFVVIIDVVMFLHACDLARTKGPAKKLAFPSVSQTTNPYAVLATVLLVLGRKLDNAMQIKVLLQLFNCTCQVPVCDQSCRKSWMNARLASEQQSASLI